MSFRGRGWTGPQASAAPSSTAIKDTATVIKDTATAIKDTATAIKDTRAVDHTGCP